MNSLCHMPDKNLNWPHRNDLKSNRNTDICKFPTVTIDLCPFVDSQWLLSRDIPFVIAVPVRCAARRCLDERKSLDRAVLAARSVLLPIMCSQAHYSHRPIIATITIFFHADTAMECWETNRKIILRSTNDMLMFPVKHYYDTYEFLSDRAMHGLIYVPAWYLRSIRTVYGPGASVDVTLCYILVHNNIIRGLVWLVYWIGPVCKQAIGESMLASRNYNCV